MLHTITGHVSGREDISGDSDRPLESLQFQRIVPEAELMQKLDALPDRTIFQTKPWLDFICRTQKAEPMFGAFSNGHDELGWFSGFVIRKGGLRILGSPFRGWTTPYLGFNLKEGVSRAAAVRVLKEYAFRHLGCVHVELMDRHLTVEEATDAKLSFKLYHTFEVSLEGTDADLFRAMNHSKPQYIRKAIRERHVLVEQARDADFADEFYAQLKDVFSKRGLVPTYSLERVKALIECLQPTGRLLLVRARDSTGRSVATGIFPAFNRTMYAWAQASWQDCQKLHPNEPLHWFAMCYWRERGMLRYDMVGRGDYKAQYGGQLIEIPWISEPRWPVIGQCRRLAQYCYSALQRLRGMCRAETPSHEQ